MGRSKRNTGIHPLSYMGVEATTPPQLIQKDHDPTSEQGDNIGTIWVNYLTQDVWMLTNRDGGDSIWSKLSNEDLIVNADTGVATEADGEINIIGSGVLNTTGATDTLTLGMTAAADGRVIISGSGIDPAWGLITSSNGSLTITPGPNTIDIIRTGGGGADTFLTDAGNAVTAGGQINILGGASINTSGAGSTVTINMDADPVFTNLGAGFIESSAGGVLSNSEGTDGQIIIGATGAPGAWANLTSTSGTIQITEGTNTLNIEDATALGSPWIPNNSNLAGQITGGGGINGLSYDTGSSTWVLASSANPNNRIFTSPDRITWTQRFTEVVIGRDDYTRVVCGSDGFCVAAPTNAVAGASQVVVATDPTSTWTAYGSITANNPKAVFTSLTQGGSHWVLTANALVYTATDPTGAWTQNTSGLTHSLNDAAYGNAVWVVVGDSGNVATAADPTGAWTVRTSGVGSNVTTVAFSPTSGLFCMGGSTGLMATSPDGITWTPRVNICPVSADLVGMHWDGANGLFVVVSDGASGITALSYNGITWFQDYRNFQSGSNKGPITDSSGNLMMWASDSSTPQTSSVF